MPIIIEFGQNWNRCGVDTVGAKPLDNPLMSFRGALFAPRNLVRGVQTRLLSNLDAKLRLEMRGEITRLHREAGATTVYVTHDQVEALTLSDIVVVMHNGVVQQVASPQQLYRHPANLFVADFIGSPTTNLIRGRAQIVQNRLVVQHADWTVPTDAPHTLANREVVAAIRPEDIELSPTETPEHARFTVYSVLPMGAELIVQAKRNDLLVTVRLAREIPLEIDAPVYLRVSPAAINVYDGETQMLVQPQS